MKHTDWIWICRQKDWLALVVAKTSQVGQGGRFCEATSPSQVLQVAPKLEQGLAQAARVAEPLSSGARAAAKEARSGEGLGREGSSKSEFHTIVSHGSVVFN